ncbi:UNVERIFIED_CONTAM: radical SAM-linked protein [Acetivibrio alkalicellulosi]
MEVFVINSIRAKFTRGEEVKYISHLDLMKMFERALRRSGLPIAYSKGFNPHPQLVFGLPLSVGVTSEAEYLDLDFDIELEPDEFTERLNKFLPRGVVITDAKKKTEKSNIMASIAGATYEILISSSTYVEMDQIKNILRSFLERDEIIIQKQSKSKVKMVDIRPMIHSIYIKSINVKGDKLHLENDICDDPWILNYVEKFYDDLPENLFCLSMVLSAGSVANLKPEYLVKALNNVYDCDFEIIKIHRSGLLTGKAERFTDPLNEVYN